MEHTLYSGRRGARAAQTVTTLSVPEMEQSRKVSFLEALANLIVGFALSIIISKVYYGEVVSYEEVTVLTLILSVVSVVRSYCLRRYFNYQIRRSSL